MYARVWGCRGSVAAPGADTVRYGGNTSCIEVRTESGDLIVLDAGTGIRALGAAVEREPPEQVHILLTHLHMDHLQGLGFFRPLFRPGADVHVWGPASPVQSLADRIAIYLSPPLFPVRLADVGARITFHDATEEPTAIGSATVRAGDIAHQGPTVGYRIEEGARSLAYLPDHEPSLGVELADLPPSWISGHTVAAGVDVLFHDAQYGDHEYPAHVGWGHSAFEHVLRFAQKAGVGRVVLFHHDPYHTDAELEALLAETHERWHTDDEQVCLAHEGMVVTLDADGVRVAAGSPA
ncbi:MAG TPA: MBL fold metallo-hydrolase [Acidimicrobiia bacterium]|jgi:phosphoribosyl 1,2-cyclic phosphodiesterase